MTIRDTEYFLNGKDSRQRIAKMEEAYDPATTRRLDGLGVGLGWRCLEVGAGGGSIARWLGDRVGPAGSVLAVDLDVSNVEDAGDNIAARRMDLRSEQPPVAEFDLVHCRLVLGHVAEREEILRSLIASLSPGGWLLVEEADSFATGTMDNELHMNAMTVALATLERVGGFAHRWGRELPGLVRDGGLEDISVTCEVPFLAGGSPGIEWLHSSWLQMRSQGLTEGVDTDWFDQWTQMVENRGQWFVGLSLIAVSGKRALA